MYIYLKGSDTPWVAKKLNITTKYDFFPHSFNHGQMHLNLNLVDASAVVFFYDV